MRIAAVSCALLASVASSLACSIGCSPATTPAPVDPAVTLVVAPSAATPAKVIEAPGEPLAAATSEPPSDDPETPEPAPIVPPRGRGRPPRQQTPAMRLSTLRRGVTVKWSTKVGKTTFRTTMAQAGDKIVIGTHGATLGGQNERDDGVYVLDAKTGAVKVAIATPGAGDRDVGGVAVDADRVYFTTDNGQLVCATLAGLVTWKVQLHGKVRPAPALADLDGDGQVDVVVGDELGFLSAFEGKSGRRLWQKTTSVNEYGAKGYVGGPAIVDVDGDGKDDVVAGARDGVLAAYRGRDGQVLWSVSNTSGIHASPVVFDADGDGRMEILAAWSYSDVRILDAKTGGARWSQTLEQDSGGIEGLFGTPVPVPFPAQAGSGPILLAPTAWWGRDDGIIEVGPQRRAFRSQEGRVSSTAIVTDLDGDGAIEAILGTESGQILALGANGTRAIVAAVKGAIEAPMMLADVDGDGTFELLVASNDGSLTCYTTGSTARPTIARFRGDTPHNRGAIGVKLAGWPLTPLPSTAVLIPPPSGVGGVKRGPVPGF
jgi:outer membrane protein assembly factor BamB